MTSARSANNSRLGNESASTNTSQSPVAAEAPLLRAREIWFIGSSTTVASAARAFSAVRSLELLSQTMISLCPPSAAEAAALPTPSSYANPIVALDLALRANRGRKKFRHEDCCRHRSLQGP